MEMHEIYLVSSIHISLPIPLNEVNREWAKGTDDERSGSEGKRMRWDGEEGTSERSYLIPLGPSVCRLASSFFLHLPPPGGPDDRRDREGGGKSRERDRKERRVKWRDRSCSALYLVILSSPFTFLARRARFGSDETMTRRKRNEKSRGRDEMNRTGERHE